MTGGGWSGTVGADGDHRDTRAHEALWERTWDRGGVDGGEAGRGVRVPRAQRRRQDDDDPHAARPAASDERQRATVRPRQPPRQPRDPRPARQPAGRLRLRPAAHRPRARVVPSPRCAGCAVSGGPPSWRSASNADLDRPLGHLSRGNRQKIGLIQALFHEPELLILDEPTGGLDPLMQEEFHACRGRGARARHDDPAVLARPRRGPARCATASRSSATGDSSPSRASPSSPGAATAT